tara:strand:- start:25863 stop:26573 length:711 start_codon:yes stop_codon:yes gene_type:complete
MATTNVTAGLQGTVGIFGFNIANFSAIRNASSGSFAQTFSSQSDQGSAITVSFESARFGNSGEISRAFVFFDLDSISTTITALSLQVTGVSNSSSSVIPVKASAWGGNGSTTSLNNASFNDLSFSNTYASSISNWNSSGQNSFTLNNSAISDANNNGYLNVALINSTADQPGTTPSFPNNPATAGIVFKKTSAPIRLVVTHADAGYGNEVNGVAGSDINTVIGVSSANIARVIGVP